MMICVGVDMHKQSDATAEVDMYLNEIFRKIVLWNFQEL